MGGAPSTILHEPALLLGGVDALKQDDGNDFLADHRIAAVVSVCDERPADRDGLNVMHINLEDRPETELGPLFAEAAAFVHRARVGGGAVYVHCTAGISRSTTIVVAYLMSSLGLTHGEALGHIHRCRDTVCPNEGFLAQLDAFEGDPAAAVGKELAAIAKALGKTDEAQRLRERDLDAVAASLHAAEEAARAYAAASWFYRADAAPVPEHLVADIHDPGDGNGPRVEGRMVRPRGGDDFGAGSVNFGLVNWKAQKRKLRKLLRQRKREAGGSVGLEWLLPPSTTKTWDDYKAWLREQEGKK